MRQLRPEFLPGAEPGEEAGAGEGVAPLNDEATGGRAVGGAGLVAAGQDTVGVARQITWGIPDNNNRGDGGSFQASLSNSNGLFHLGTPLSGVLANHHTKKTSS